MKNPAEAAVEQAVRLYSRHEHLADAVVHVLGSVFAINASLWLLFHVTGLPVVVSVTVYCIGLLAMIGFSAANNLVPHHRPSKQVLRRHDHTTNNNKNTSTFTPLAVNRLDSTSGTLILVLI